MSAGPNPTRLRDSKCVPAVGNLVSDFRDNVIVDIPKWRKLSASAAQRRTFAAGATKIENRE
jgi:hypothetical protein